MYPYNLAHDKSYILSVLENAFKNRTPDEVDYALSLLTLDEPFNSTDTYVEVLCKLLTVDWNYNHEDIVSLLQGVKSSLCVDQLYETSFKKFDYLAYDDSHALAVTCIYALGAIGTHNALEKLKLLAESDNSIISQSAKNQLMNIN